MTDDIKTRLDEVKLKATIRRWLTTGVLALTITSAAWTDSAAWFFIMICLAVDTGRLIVWDTLLGAAGHIPDKHDPKQAERSDAVNHTD